MNRKELRYAILRSGLSNRDLARELGISEGALYNKMRGKREFKLNEVKALYVLLKLTRGEFDSIFLS